MPTDATTRIQITERIQKILTNAGWPATPELFTGNVEVSETKYNGLTIIDVYPLTQEDD